MRGWIYTATWSALRDFVVNWWPLLGLSFYCVLLYIFWRMLQLMPRVKPAEVIVDTAVRRSTGVTLPEADEARPSCSRSSSSPRPERFHRARCGRAKGCCCTARRERGRRCSRAQPPTNRVRSSTRRAHRVPSRCSRASGGSHPEALRRGAKACTRHHTSSTSSTAVAPLG